VTEVEVSLDALLGQACWDITVARRVVAELPDDLVGPPRLAAFLALTSLVTPTLDVIDPPMVMQRVMTDKNPGWEDTCRWLPNVTTGMWVGTSGWHLDIIREATARERLFQTAARTQQMAATADLADAVSLAREGLDRIQVRTADAPPTIADLLMPHLERLETQDTTKRLSTGLPDLDHLLAGGFRPGQLVIVGARPGVGKSLLLGGFALHAAIREHATVHFASLEMGREELMDRFLASEASVSLRAITGRSLDEEGWSRLARHLDDISSARLHIDDTPTQTVPAIAAAAKPQRPALVLVDYLQLVCPAGKTNNREQEVAALSRALKLLARDLDCTVIAASQLNRESDKRNDRKPRLSDLRESGAIEADADLVLLLDRDDNDETLGTDASLIVAKQRGGPLGSVPLVFSGDHARFMSAWRGR
jgi:replicative DNA helicase